jgi:DNA-binding transcriptional LysR family regulator
MRLNYNHIMVLLDVAESGSINAAAQMRHVAQSAVSRTMRELELSMGVKLLERHARGIELTEPGRTLVQLAKNIRAEANATRRELARLQEGESTTTLVIGAHPTLAAFVLPQVISRFSERIPECHISVREGMKETLLPALGHGDLDVVVCRIGNTPVPSDLVEEHIYQDTMVIVSGRNHPLAARRRVRPEELAAGRWVLPPEDAEPYQDVVEVFQSLGLQIPTPKDQSASVALNRTLLSSEQDWLAVMPRDLFWTDLHQRRLKVLHELPSAKRRTIGLILRRRAGPTPKREVGSFCECLKEVIGVRTDGAAPQG